MKLFFSRSHAHRVFIRELSMVPLFPMILFGGTGVELELQRGHFVLNLEDGWIKFVTADHKVAELLKDIRTELDLVLEEKIKDPSLNLLTYGRGKLVIDTIVSVISNE